MYPASSNESDYCSDDEQQRGKEVREHVRKLLRKLAALLTEKRKKGQVQLPPVLDRLGR